MAGRRLAVALGVAAALSGCGGGDEVYFDLDVVVASGCPQPLPQLDNWVLKLRQDGEEQCVRGPCIPPTNQPFDCVAGTETPAVEPDQTLVVTFGVYDAAGNLVACEDRFLENGVEEGDRVVLMVQCGGPAFGKCPDRPPMMDCSVQQP